MKYLFLIIWMLPFLATAQISTTLQDGGRFYVVVEGDTVSQHVRVDKAIESASNYPEWEIVQDFRLSGSSFFYDDDIIIEEVTDTVYADTVYVNLPPHDNSFLHSVDWTHKVDREAGEERINFVIKTENVDSLITEIRCGNEWVKERVFPDSDDGIGPPANTLHYGILWDCDSDLIYQFRAHKGVWEQAITERFPAFAFELTESEQAWIDSVKKKDSVMTGSGTDSDPFIIESLSDWNTIQTGDRTAVYEWVNNIDAFGEVVVSIRSSFTGKMKMNGFKMLNIQKIENEFGSDTGGIIRVDSGGLLENGEFNFSMESGVYNRPIRQGNGATVRGIKISGFANTSSTNDVSGHTSSVNDDAISENNYSEIDIIAPNASDAAGFVNNIQTASTIISFLFTGTINSPNAFGLSSSDFNTDKLFQSFWDFEKSGIVNSEGGTGISTADAKDINTYLNVGWDIVDISSHDGEENTAAWFIDDGNDYPRLWFEWEPTEGEAIEGDAAIIESSENITALASLDILAVTDLSDNDDEAALNGDLVLNSESILIEQPETAQSTATILISGIGSAVDIIDQVESAGGVLIEATATINDSPEQIQITGAFEDVVEASVQILELAEQAGGSGSVVISSAGQVNENTETAQATSEIIISSAAELADLPGALAGQMVLLISSSGSITDLQDDMNAQLSVSLSGSTELFEIPEQLQGFATFEEVITAAAHIVEHAEVMGGNASILISGNAEGRELPEQVVIDSSVYLSAGAELAEDPEAIAVLSKIAIDLAASITENPEQVLAVETVISDRVKIRVTGQRIGNRTVISGERVGSIAKISGTAIKNRVSL